MQAPVQKGLVALGGTIDAPSIADHPLSTGGTTPFHLQLSFNILFDNVWVLIWERHTHRQSILRRFDDGINLYALFMFSTVIPAILMKHFT